MGTERHSIRKQTLRVDARSEAVAMALQARLPDLHRTDMLATIERVFDQYATPGQHVRLDRLRLDLGTIPFGREFPEEVCARLERELRAALDTALRDVLDHPSPGRFAQSAEEARLDALEYYLTEGTVPFWKSATDFDPEAVIEEAAAATPEALVRLLRIHRADPLVIHRLIRQLSDAGLHRLLSLLAPGPAPQAASGIDAANGGGAAGEKARWMSGTEPIEREDARASIWFRLLTAALHERPIVSGPAAEGTAQPGWDAVLEAEQDVSPYDVAETLRFYLRHGVLPWTVALARPAVNDWQSPVRALVDALPDLPPTLVRAIFPASPAERAMAVRRTLDRMSEDARARLFVTLAPARAGSASGDPARVLLHMLDRGEEAGPWTGSSPGPGGGEVLADEWSAPWIKSILTDRARTGRGPGPGEPASSALLQVLLDERPADASHFLRVLRAAGIAPAVLLAEPVSSALLESGLKMLAPGGSRIVHVLLRLVSGLPAHEQPGDDDAVRAAALGAVFDEVAGSAAAVGDEAHGLVARLARALFAPALPDAVAGLLSAGAERLARTGECTVADLSALRAGLDASMSRAPTDRRPWDAELAEDIDRGLRDATGAGVSAFEPQVPGRAARAQGLEAQLEQLPPAAARRVTHLVAIVSTWPAADRAGSDDEMRAAVAHAIETHGRDAALATQFMDVVLRAIFGPHAPAGTARRLTAGVQALAGRGLITVDDADAIREAVAALGDETGEPAAQAGRPRLSAEEIRAELMARNRGQGSSAPGGIRSSQLLRTLIDSYPVEARSVLRDLRQGGTNIARLLDGVAEPGLIEAVLGLLRPLDRELVALLVRAVDLLPAASRPGREAVRAAMAAVVLDHADAQYGGEAIAAAALRALFGAALPAGMQPRLVAEAARLARGGQTGPAAFAVLLRVLGWPAEPGPDVPLAEPIEPDATLEILAAGAADGPDEADMRSPRQEHGFSTKGSAPEDPESHARVVVRQRAARTAATPGEVDAVLANLRGRDLVAPPASSQPREGAGDRPGGLTDDAVRQVLREVVGTAPDAVRDALSAGIGVAAVRERWLQTFTEAELARIVSVLDPAHHRVVIASSELLFSAWDSGASRPRTATTVRLALWSFVLGWLSRYPEGQRSVRVLVRGFFSFIGVHPAAPGVPADREEEGQRIYAEAVDLAGRMGRAQLRAVLSEDRAELLSLVTGRVPADPPDRLPVSGGATTSPARSRQRMAFGMTGDQVDAGGDAIHVANAGLVIAGAFLPQLFARLDVLEEAPAGGTRVRLDAVSRTVHLLQYLVDGRTDAPEALLCLNKVLCGLPPAIPVDRGIDMTARERELCDSLLAGVIENWTIIKGTSIDGLRETFLQREGRLDHPSTGWRIRVQRRTLDVLLDHLPWPVSTIAHSWMTEPLYVTW